MDQQPHKKSLVLIALVTTTLKLKNKTGFLMTKKRVKKYNRVEAARRNNERILKGLAVCYFVNDNTPKQDIILTNLKGERAHITKTSDAITCHRYKWQIYLCAGTTNTKGEKELKVEPVMCKQPYLQSELVGF